MPWASGWMSLGLFIQCQRLVVKLKTVQDKGDSDGEEIHCREPNSTTANPILTVLRHSSSGVRKLSCLPEHLFPVRKNVAFSHLMLVLGEIYSYAMKIITSQILPPCLFSFFTQTMTFGQFKIVPSMCTLFLVFFLIVSLMIQWSWRSNIESAQCNFLIDFFCKTISGSDWVTDFTFKDILRQASPQQQLGFLKEIVMIVKQWSSSPPRGFPGGTSGKETTCQRRRQNWQGFDPWVRKIPWRRAWQPTPVLLPGEIPMNREAWRTAVYEVAKSQTWLKGLSMHTLFPGQDVYLQVENDGSSISKRWFPPFY